MNIVKFINRKIYVLISGLLLVALSASKCDKSIFGERFYPIEIQNNSSDTIYADLGLPNRDPLMVYPDTILPSNKPSLMYILQGYSFNFDFRKPQEQLVSELKADTLSIYIFEQSVYKDTLWANVRSKYLVSKRYDLSIDDLRKLNFKVPYPPTTEMVGMKMYP